MGTTMLPGGAAAESGGHRRETHGAELPVPVQLHVAGEFETAEVDHETEKADQDQGQDVGRLSGHRHPVDEMQPVRIEKRQQGALRRLGHAREQQARALSVLGGDVEPREHDVEQSDRGGETRRQDQRALPAPRRRQQAKAVGNTQAPPGESHGFEQGTERFRLQPHSQLGQRHQDRDGAGAGNESAGQRIGNEADEVSQSEPADQCRAEACRQGAERGDRRHRDEETVALKGQAGAYPGHHDHQRGRRGRDRAPEPARESGNQGDETAPQQDEADAVGRVGGQISGVDETAEGNRADDDVRGRDQRESEGGNDGGESPVRTHLRPASLGV